jgi:hypothetical protein
MGYFSPIMKIQWNYTSSKGFARNNGVCVYWGDCPGHDGTSNPPQPELSISHGRLEIENKKKSNDADYSCESEFRWPAGCRPGENCEYMASWEFNPDNEDVQFSVSSKGIGRWSGIGFSRNGLMANSVCLKI